MKKLFAIVLTLVAYRHCYALPAEFTYVDDPRFIQSMNYATQDNFVGRPIVGYEIKKCILTKQAYDKLIAVQDELDSLKKGYKIKLFDCYRPAQAVADFEKWSKDPHDQKTRSKYYPDFAKPDLFTLGYIADKSGHSRGSTVDLTITQQSVNNPFEYQDLEMGTIFDFFGEKSNTASKNVSKKAQENRKLLLTLMEKHGFKNLDLEWWHYTLVNEPFSDTYFDFPVK